MKTISISKDNLPEINKIDMIDFYNEATEDYNFWSKDFNMHFGYYIPFKTNLLKRDSMLNELNNQVIARLNIKYGKKSLVDLGCGMGATMRYALKQNNELTAIGVTLSNFQVRKGNKLLEKERGVIINENYNHTSFETNQFDAALAIESFCHSGHSSVTLKEAFRILKPGSSLVIADAFLKKNLNQLYLGSRYSYQRLCDHWSLEKLEHIETYSEKLKKAGFTNLKVENLSLRVAPSVLHVPFAILGFFLKSILQFKPLKRESLHNLKGSFHALIAGLHMRSFGYYMITAYKSE